MNKIINIFIILLLILIMPLALAATAPAITNVINVSSNSTQQYVNWTVNQTAHNRVVYGYTQGTENVRSCAGTWAVGWECANSYDGNWSTYAMASAGTTGYIYFNYTIPANASRLDTEYHIKDGGATAEHNLTIPADCWGSIVYARATSDHDGAHSIAWHCYNGTTWISMYNEIDTRAIYEQEMLWYKWSSWDNSTAAPNVTLSGLTAVTTYDFRVWSYNTSDTSHNSNSTTYTFTTVAGAIATYMPPDPTTLTNTFGNYWVNYSWAVGSGNVTDSYNVSHNGVWTNNTTITYTKNEVGCDNWSNITVWAFNSTGAGTLSNNRITDQVQAIIEKFTNPTFVVAAGAVVLAIGAFLKVAGSWSNRRRKRF